MPIPKSMLMILISFIGINLGRDFASTEAILMAERKANSDLNLQVETQTELARSFKEKLSTTVIDTNSYVYIICLYI